MTPEQEQEILDSLARAIKAQAQAAFEEMMTRINAGESPREAMDAVTAQFSGQYYAELSAAFSAVLDSAIGIAEIKQWPVGDVALSKHLYRHTAQVNQVARQLIANQAKGFVQMRELAMQIYEGYRFKDNPLKVKAKLPKYLREALRDPAIDNGFARIVAQIRVNQLKTPALKAAYSQMLDALEQEAGAARLKKLLRTAWYERNRYFANRIAQTELHRAYSNQVAQEIMADEEAVWVKIKMSPTHPKRDICFRAGTMVMTASGEKPIESVDIGDQVFTHKGRYQKVIRLYKSWIAPRGNLRQVTIESNGHQPVTLTPNHPVLTSSGWIPASDLHVGSVCLSVGSSCQRSRLACDETGTGSSGFAENLQGQGQKTASSLLCGELEVVQWHRTLRNKLKRFQEPNFWQAIVTCIFRTSRNFLLSSSDYLDQTLMPLWKRGLQQNDGTCPSFALQNLDCLSLQVAGTFWNNTSFPDPEEQIGPCMSGMFSFGMTQNNTSALVSVSGRLDYTDDTFSQSLQSSADINTCMISQIEDINSNGEWVYNLEVEGDNSYVAGGIIVHNCDYHAGLNAYGMGPGVYPKALAPKPGFHPHCRCVAVVRYDLDADAPQALIKDAPQRFMNRLSPYDQRLIAGSRARLEAFKNGRSLESIYNATTKKEYRWRKLGDGVERAVKSAYEVAKEGGKHAGLLRNYSDLPSAMIERGIKKMNRRIDEHQSWIVDPFLKLDQGTDPREISALVNKKWPSDIARIREEMSVLQGIIDARRNHGK